MHLPHIFHTSTKHPTNIFYTSYKQENSSHEYGCCFHLIIDMIGETIVNLMFTYDRITPPIDNNAANRINTLAREGLLSQDLISILHALRKIRNKAVHENYTSISDGKVLLQMSYKLCEWFMQTYGDWNYQNQPFVMPVEEIIRISLPGSPSYSYQNASLM